MKRVIFLYSGEGTRSTTSSYKLIQKSKYWSQIEEILQSKLGISLEKSWSENPDLHKCPESPLLTVATQICLSDIWQQWGYKADLVVGHSIGELTAAFQAGFYTLEEILLLTHDIAQITKKHNGVMFHGSIADTQIDDLHGSLASYNFRLKKNKHITVSCLNDEQAVFHEQFPHFHKMKPEHPWHHRAYTELTKGLADHPAGSNTGALFVSGVSTQLENTLEPGHWRKWLSEPIDFISTIDGVREHFHGEQLQIIEIGFHPVLERCCEVFDSFRYASSMYREEDEIEWICHQRKKLDEQVFLDRLKAAIEQFRPGIDYATSLSYQDFTSLTFVEFAAILQPFFPNLAPQDFYRYKTIQQLIERYGVASDQSIVKQKQYQKNEVVVSAMSCKFPASVENPHQFWQMLQEGQDQVRADGARGDFEAGFLSKQTSQFDHKYFNISEAEAKTMDPQQILALELTEMLWKDAAIDPETLNKKRVGVYIGAWNDEFQGHRDSVYYPTGCNASIIASRISYHYDLRGPSWVANTACSSSLLAVHYACKDIEAGRVDFAIAGGVNMILGNEFTHAMRDSGFLSADQRCKAFDDSAKGYVRAEGGGLVLLVNKDLAEKYYAEIAGSSINQNGGRAQVITAPHPEAQEELIVDACLDAEIKPSDISYVECHGTGTKIGDPIEISAIQNTIAKNRETDCFLGTVKSNIGHLESAAGIAGLLKSLLILNHGKIPANLHFDTPNQFIDFDSYHLQVVAKETELDPLSYIGVSSFGFGGANAHVILKGVEHYKRKEVVDTPRPFDKERATPLSSYYELEHDDKGGEEAGQTNINSPATDIKKLISEVFYELTGINEIDPDVDFTDQGLDSLSATQFITTLQERLGVELDADILFDSPFLDQLVTVLEEKSSTTAAGVAGEDSKGSLNKEELAELISKIFYELTNIKTIDPDIELTDQGLDSLSATQLISQLEKELKVEIDTDVLFEYPLYDQLVDEIYARAQVEELA